MRARQNQQKDKKKKKPWLALRAYWTTASSSLRARQRSTSVHAAPGTRQGSAPLSTAACVSMKNIISLSSATFISAKPKSGEHVPLEGEIAELVTKGVGQKNTRLAERRVAGDARGMTQRQP